MAAVTKRRQQLEAIAKFWHDTRRELQIEGAVRQQAKRARDLEPVVHAHRLRMQGQALTRRNRLIAADDEPARSALAHHAAQAERARNVIALRIHHPDTAVRVHDDIAE